MCVFLLIKVLSESFRKALQNALRSSWGQSAINSLTDFMLDWIPKEEAKDSGNRKALNILKA